jgi:hypothetical protein
VTVPWILDITLTEGSSCLSDVGASDYNYVYEYEYNFDLSLLNLTHWLSIPICASAQWLRERLFGNFIH